MEHLVSVDAPHYNAGLIIRGNKVVEAAPILKWTIGRPAKDVFAYFKRKGYTYEFLSNDDE